MQNSLRRARPLLGTLVEISVLDTPGQEADAIIDEAFAAVAEVHRLMSFHDVNSDISRLNREASARPVRVHPWTFEVLRTAIELRDRSSGLFDISVAPALQELGLLPANLGYRSAPPIQTPSAGKFEVLPDRQIRFREPSVRIDLGGIAKGFAVDRAVEVLQDCGVSSGLVNAGGDLAAFGGNPHQIYIRDPRDPRRLICQVKVSNGALASTGGRFDLFCSATISGSTVIDPRTRRPVATISGATVCARSCMIADALTKIVMISGKSAATVLRDYRASALMVSDDGDVRVTSDWQGAVNLAA